MHLLQNRFPDSIWAPESMVHCPMNHRSGHGGGREPWQRRIAFTVVCLCSHGWDLLGLQTTQCFHFKKKNKPNQNPNWFYKWVKSFIFSKVLSGNYCIWGFCLCFLGNVMLQWSAGWGKAFGLVSEEQPSGSRVSAGMARNCLAASGGSSTWRCSIPSVLLTWWVSRAEKGLRCYLRSGIQKR